MCFMCLWMSLVNMVSVTFEKRSLEKIFPLLHRVSPRLSRDPCEGSGWSRTVNPEGSTSLLELECPNTQHWALWSVYQDVYRNQCWKAWFIKSVIDHMPGAATQAPRGHMEAPPNTWGAQQIPVSPPSVYGRHIHQLFVPAKHRTLQYPI